MHSDLTAQPVPIERVIAELVAATALLQDRRVAPSMALVHLLEGWRLLGEGEAGAEALLALQARLKRGEGPEPGRREMKKALRQLALAVHLAGPKRPSGSRNRRRAVIGGLLIVGLVTVSAVLSLSLGPNLHGWRASYYPDGDLEGSPVHRTEAELVHDWGMGSPTWSLPRNAFSARWDTCLEIEVRGKVKLSAGGDDGYRVWVDGRRIINRWLKQDIHWSYSTLDLQPGLHHLRVEYFEGTGKAKMAVYVAPISIAEAPRVVIQALGPEHYWIPREPWDAKAPCEGLE